MPTQLKTAVLKYLRSGNLAIGTRKEYLSTLRKWSDWSANVPIEELTRQDIRNFIDWVHDRAVEHSGTNPGRTANKSRENLWAIMSWAWERDMVEVLPRFPKPRPHRRVAGRHYLTKAEINALYFATHKMQRPRGWNQSIPVGRYWRSALVVFFNYGLDTGIETGEKKPWFLKDLRKTCATYYDEHIPESSVEILGHSVGGVTYRHYAHRAPLAFRAITTMPQPSAFAAMVNGFDGQCPCCRREFDDAA